MSEPFDWTAPHTQEEYEEENANIFAQRLADTIDKEILEDCLMSMVESPHFIPLTKEAMAEPEIKKSKNPVASPTVSKAAVIDWLLILPSGYSDEPTVDMAMYLKSSYPPTLIERGDKKYRLKYWTGADTGTGTARYTVAYGTREGEVYREWSDLKKATNKDMDALIETWKEEFGDVIDSAMGLEGVTSMVLDGTGRELRAGAWLERDDDGCLEHLNWTVTGIVSDKVGLRHVSVWKNNYPSDNKGAYGWSVRMGGPQLGVSGGVGMKELTGYSDTLDKAKTDGMKALLEVNRVIELKAEEKKRLTEMVSAPMMPAEDTDDS